jgi:hypothetical protein
MTQDLFRAFLGWSAAINFGLLLFSWVMLMVGRDAIYRIHNGFFPMSKEAWSQSMFMSLSYYKITTFVFFVVPYFALRLIGG